MRLVSNDQIAETNRVLSENEPSTRFYVPPVAVTVTGLLRGPISVSLRNDLAHIHDELEQLSQIPQRIKTIQDYLACLKMYLGIFQPFEAALAAQKKWGIVGIDFHNRRRTPALIADIVALGGVATVAPPADGGRLPSFAEALGAFYVLEGSALGGRLILRALERTLGARLSGATRFFEGHGAEASPRWLAFKHAVDAYGEENHDEYDLILRGAICCYDIFKTAAKKNL